jgi:diaminopropionate ammonia-lyase
MSSIPNAHRTRAPDRGVSLHYSEPTMRGFVNPLPARSASFRGLFADDDYRDVRAYFMAHPELSPTPLRKLPTLAASLGLGAVSVKDESGRFGLNAFKILGVRYAIHRLMSGSDHDSRSGERIDHASIPDLATRGVVCATAGNHGRAVARVASDHRLPCTVFVSAPGEGDSPVDRRSRGVRVAGMQADGATVVEVSGSYEEALRRAAEHASTTGAVVVSDTSLPGSDEIPCFIMSGYTQILVEAYEQWHRMPDVILVQGGVGGLVCAVASWCAWRFGAARPYVIACEPDGAACLLASAEAGKPIALAGPLQTSMAGLRCAEPSWAAWPAIARAVDAFVSIPDSHVLDMVERLAKPAGADPPIQAGLSGACGAAALVAVARAPELAHVRRAARIDRSTHAFVIVTEGP